MWVGGIDDYGCGSVVSMIMELVFLLFFGVFWFFLLGLFLYFFFFYWFSLGFRCDRLVWISVSILLHSGRPKALILREMVVDDGGYMGLVGVGGRNLGP